MRIHLIGIGGIGMSGLAQILLARGDRVSGSDAEGGPLCSKLRTLGVRVHVGHAASHLDHPDLVVYSSAIAPGNPELVRARNRGLPVLSRGQMVAQLVRHHRVLAVTGAHGKSTTTAMLAQLLLSVGWDPTVLLGAELDALGGNARWGRGPYAVIEADESDGSFLWLKPTVAVITNLDEEHLDFFRNRSDIERAYRLFIQRIHPQGHLIACADDGWLMRILSDRPDVLLYGFSPKAHFQAKSVILKDGTSRYRYWEYGKPMGEITLSIPGRHNVQNSLAVLAVAKCLGIPLTLAQETLNLYRGARRRFQIHGQPQGILVVEDYGHHPAEIEATLKAARSWGRPIRCVFQPHRYTRTRYLMDRLAKAFDQAEEVILMPVYPASEQPIEGADTKALYAAMQAAGHSHVKYLVRSDQVLRYLKQVARAGDIILFLGAGDVGRLACRLVEQLDEHSY